MFTEWAYPMFESKLAMWMLVNDPIDPATMDDAEFDQRGLAVAKAVGNTVFGEFSMPTVMWEQFLSFVPPRYDRMWAEDWAEAKERLGDDAAPELLHRTEKQRWLDAMMEAIRASAGDAAGADYVVNLICDMETFEAELALQLAEDEAAHLATLPEPELVRPEPVIEAELTEEPEPGTAVEPVASVEPLAYCMSSRSTR